MTARERDPQGASLPAARLEAIRERLAKFKHTEEGGPLEADSEYCEHCGDSWRTHACVVADVAWLLARLAPATPSGAATGGGAESHVCPLWS